MAVARFHLDRTALLLVDMQEKLLPHIHDHEMVLDQAGRLLDAANALDLPVLVTEQYRKGLGDTVPALRNRLTSTACIFEKLKFSACIEPVRRELSRRSLTSVVVCGIEAHVCILQTCLDLVERGHTAALAVDAIGSRRSADKNAAIDRMTQAGIVPTTVESVVLELVREAGGARFKAVLPIIK